MFPFVTGHSWKYGPTKTAKTSPQKITSVCTDRKSFAIIRTIWMKYPKNKTSAFRVKIENERFTFDFSCCRQNLKKFGDLTSLFRAARAARAARLFFLF